MTTTPHNPSAGAFTIVELLIALAISSIVMASVPFMIALSSRAAPTAGSIQTSAAQAADCFAQMQSDLQLARSITDLKANSIAMVVPSRSGSGVAQTIEYSWAGSVGDPVVMTIDGTPEEIVSAADSFTLAAASGPRTVYTEVSLAYDRSKSLQSATSGTPINVTIPASGALVQLISPGLSADAVGWSVGEITVALGVASPVSGQSVVLQIRAINADRSLGGTVYSTLTLDSTALPRSATAATYKIPPVWLPTDQTLGLVLTVTSSSLSAVVSAVPTPVGYTGGTLYAGNSMTGPWAASTGRVLYQSLTGTVLTAAGGASTRTTLDRLDVSLTIGDADWTYATSITPLNPAAMP